MNSFHQLGSRSDWVNKDLRQYHVHGTAGCWSGKTHWYARNRRYRTNERECNNLAMYQTTCIETQQEKTWSCPTLLWETLVRHSCKMFLEDPLAWYSCETRLTTLLSTTLVYHPFGTLFWGILPARHYLGTISWDILVEHCCAALMWDTCEKFTPLSPRFWWENTTLSEDISRCTCHTNWSVTSHSAAHSNGPKNGRQRPMTQV